MMTDEEDGVDDLIGAQAQAPTRDTRLAQAAADEELHDSRRRPPRTPPPLVNPFRPRASSESGPVAFSSPFASSPLAEDALRLRHRASISFDVTTSKKSTTSPLGIGADSFWTRLSSIFDTPPGSPVQASSMFSPTQANVQGGQDLEEIQSEAVGFLSIAGETKLRLLPTPWPSNSLPKPTSSLLSIASRSELVAAAGPDALVIASTAAIREAFVKDGPAENNVKSFTPQLTLPVPQVSQVAFSSDESSLSICAAEGGGLAVYDVQALKQGKKEPAFEMATNGVAVRALVPNPAPETAHFLAIVLAEGQLMVANLKDRSFISGSNGVVLRDGVSCVSWSVRGKQLVAGLGNGTAVQLDHSGEIKAEIPKFPPLSGDEHVSGIFWLDNDHFLIIYTPSNFEMDHAHDSTFAYVSREPKTTNFMFQKLPDPCPPFGMNRSPQHHFISRLKEFPPSLTDALIVSSTAAGDVGLVTCSKTPLSNEPSAANTANAYTTTGIANDARKAQLPVDDSMSDTSPIGMALDLSSKDTVSRPIPAEEIDVTSTPLPALMILNNDGVLSSWWFVYSDSVRQGTGFPGLVALSAGQQQPQTQQQQPQQSSGFSAFSQTQGGFGTSSTPSGGGFGTPGAPSFGTPSASGMGSGGAFGSSSALGANKSPWGASTSTASPQQAAGAFGKPAFGSSTPLGGGGGFGAFGGLGNRQSPWATNQTQTQQPTQSKLSNPFSNTSSASPFASMSDSNQTESAFGAFGGNTSSSSGFASLGQQTQKSIFGAPSTTAPPGLPTQPSFGSTVTIGSNLSSSFGGPSTLGEPRSAWGTPALSTNPSGAGAGFGTAQASEAEMTSGDMDSDMDTQKVGEQATTKPPDEGFGLFSNANSGFKLGSTFKRDEESKDNEKKPAGPSLFGSGFGAALQETEKSTPLVKNNESSSAGKLLQTPGSSTETPSIAKAASEKSGPGVPADDATPKSIFQLPKPSEDKEVKVEPSEEVEPAPLPPSPPTQKAQVNTEELPLPPSPKPQTQVPEELPPSPAGSPPVDLGDEHEASLSSDKSVQSEEEARVEPESAPLPPDPTPTKQQPTWSFPSPLPKSPLPEPSPNATESPLAFSATPSTISKARTPADAVKPPVFFRPSGANNESPRSPSPVRNQYPSQGQRSLSSPSPTRALRSTTPTMPPPPKQTLPTHPVSKPFFQQPSRLPPVQESASRHKETTAYDDATDEYVDDSDERIREELSSTVEPTKRLAPFLAHQDYVGKVGGQGVPAQIEKVYRDINSMIDTLGLNARSLKAFVAGHESFKDGGRIRDDLDTGKEDDWCLIEIADLGTLEKEISESLDEERMQDVGEKLEQLQTSQKDLTKLRSRHHGIQTTLRAYQNPDEDASGEVRKNLTIEQSTVLVDLRKSLVNVQKQLTQAEDAATLLRAKLTSSSGLVDSQSGRPSSAKVPTVEAILNTIAKMTRMVEQKSGDLDLVEAQMRKLRFRPKEPLDEALGQLTLENGTASGKDSNAYATPPSSRGKASGKDQADHLVTPGTYQLTYDSDEEQSEEFRDVSESPYRRSVGSARSSLKARVSGDKVAAYKAKRERRDHLVAVLRKKVCERGVRITGADGGSP